MKKACVITGKTSRKSATRSHSNIKSLTRQKANLHRRILNGKKVWVSAKAIKTMKKNAAKLAASATKKTSKKK